MRLRFQVLGEGEPLVLLHGLFGSGDNLFGLARSLSARFRCYLPDLRNHGASPHAAEMSHAVMAEDVLYLLQEEKLSHCIVVGHSMGGKTAMQLAMHFPAFVEALVVLDVAPRAYGPRHDQIIRALTSVPLGRCRTRQDVDTHLIGSIPEQGVRRFLLKSLRTDGPDGLAWKLNLSAIQSNYAALNAAPDAGAAFPGPALFLAGERSDYLVPDDHPRIRAWFPAARIASIAGAGHWLHADAPDSVLNHINGFLSTLGRRV